MRFRWMMLTFIGALFIAQAQNAPAPAVAQGPETSPEASPGVARNSPDGDSQMNPAGPGRPGPQGRRLAGPGQPGGPFAAGGRGPMAGPGGPEGGGPAIFFDQADQGDDREAIDDPEGPDGAPEGAEELSEGPRWGGGPGFGGGPGMPFGAGREPGGFGPMPPRLPGQVGEALQAVLGLDDGQVRRLRQLQREKAERVIEARRQLEQKQASLLDMLEQEEPDGNALVSTVKSIHALRKQAGEIEREFQAKTAATLNDEQRAKLKSIQEARQIRSALDEAARFELVQRAGDGPGRPGPDQ